MQGANNPSPLAPAEDGRIPVCVLTGFLGAGKTTLLNRLTRHPEMEGTALLINEFGRVGIDHHLVQSIDESMLLLDSGCLCCSMRGDFVNALRSLDERASSGRIPPIRRIIVETTGLADPVPVLYALREDRHLSSRFFCDSLLTVVDASVGPDLLGQHQEAVRQIVMADRLLISKGDISDQDRRDALDAWLDTLNPSAPRLRVNHGDVSPSRLFSEDPRDSPRDEASAAWSGHGGSHDDDVDSFTVQFPQPVSWPGLAAAMGGILRDHGAGLLRVKGIVNAAGIETPMIVHCVRAAAYPPERLASWPDEGELADRCGRLVFITRGMGEAAAADIRARLLTLPDDATAWRQVAADPNLATRCWFDRNLPPLQSRPTAYCRSEARGSSSTAILDR